MELAITKRAHPTALLLPQIKIIMDANGQLLDNPLLMDLSDKEQNRAERTIKEVVDPSTLSLNPMNFI